MEELTQEQIIQRGNQTEDIMRTSWWKHWFIPWLESDKQAALEYLATLEGGFLADKMKGQIERINITKDMLVEWIGARDRILEERKQETDNAE